MPGGFDVQALEVALSIAASIIVLAGTFYAVVTYPIRQTMKRFDERITALEEDQHQLRSWVHPPYQYRHPHDPRRPEFVEPKG